MACGDLNGYDADRSYPLSISKQRLAPLQPPIAPPYKTAVELVKHSGRASTREASCVEGNASRVDEVAGVERTSSEDTYDCQLMKRYLDLKSSV